MTIEEKQKAIDVLKISAPVMTVTQEEFKDYIQTLNKIMDWLEQEPCDDVISRDDVITIIAKKYMFKDKSDFDKCVHLIAKQVKALPSVTPKQKIGRWIDAESLDGALWHACSECGKTVYYKTNYCPNCGAKMESEVEE